MSQQSLTRYLNTHQLKRPRVYLPQPAQYTRIDSCNGRQVVSGHRHHPSPSKAIVESYSISPAAPRNASDLGRMNCVEEMVVPKIEALLSPVFKTEVPTVMADTAYTKSHFLECPREVRDMIYNLVLVGDSEIVPYPGIWEFEAASKSHPSPALLAVSKKLAYEARPILYGKNQWRLPAHTEYGLSIFSLHRLLFRDVTAFFDGRDLPDGDRAELALNRHSLPDSCFRVKDVEAAKARQIHSTYLAEISYIWSRKHALLDGMRQLRSLLINVEGLVCPSGCCRYKVLKDNLYQAALRELSRDLLGKRTWRYFQWSNDFPSIRFVGLLSEAERTLIHDTYGFPRTEAVEEAAEEEKDSEEE